MRHTIIPPNIYPQEAHQSNVNNSLNLAVYLPFLCHLFEESGQFHASNIAMLFVLVVVRITMMEYEYLPPIEEACEKHGQHDHLRRTRRYK